MMLCSSMAGISAFKSLQLAVGAPVFHPLRQGRMIACGVVHASDASQMQTAPLSQTPCLAYKFDIIESRQRSRAYLYTVCRGQWNLTVQTDSGSIAIRGCDLDLSTVHCQDSQHPFKDFLQQRSHQHLADANISSQSLVGIRRSLTLTESILRDGDKVYLMGRQTRVHQDPIIKGAIITDRPIRYFVLRATAMLVASAAVFYFSTGLILFPFR